MGDTIAIPTSTPGRMTGPPDSGETMRTRTSALAVILILGAVHARAAPEERAKAAGQALLSHISDLLDVYPPDGAICAPRRDPSPETGPRYSPHLVVLQHRLVDVRMTGDATAEGRMEFCVIGKEDGEFLNLRISGSKVVGRTYKLTLERGQWTADYPCPPLVLLSAVGSQIRSAFRGRSSANTLSLVESAGKTARPCWQ